jgi:uncharacterized protein
MSKSDRIAALTVEGTGLDPHYAGYFECFNRQEFYQAHDVLEALWLRQRGSPDDLFYKGLIQLAGAFVHLQKNRLRPADALFGLAAGNLARYPARHQQLEVAAVLGLIESWRAALRQASFELNPLTPDNAPKLAPSGRE